jgi:hypothetical protein
MEMSMHKYRSEGIEERTRLIYELGLQHDYHNISVSNNIIEAREEVAINRCKECIEYVITNGCEPPGDSQLGKWLRAMRVAYVHKTGSSIFYKSLLDIAISHGMPYFFYSTYIQNGIKNIIAIADYSNIHKFRPSYEHKNTQIRYLGQWVTRMRYAKSKKTNVHGVLAHGTFNSIYDEIAQMVGYPNMFNDNWESDFNTRYNTTAQIKFNNHRNDMYRKVIQFVKLHNKIPWSRSKNVDEKTLGMWLQRIKQHFDISKNSYKKLYERSVIDGIPNLFIVGDNEQTSINMCYEMIEYVTINNKYPTRISNSRLNRWLVGMRYTNKGSNDNIEYVLYPSIIKIIKNSKYPNMLNANWRDDLRK